MKSTIHQIEECLIPEKIEWFRLQLCIWAQSHLRDFPWRQTIDPYAILVAEFLLQKTDADTVVSIYKTFLSRYRNLQELAEADIEDLGILLRPLGLFFRAKRLHECAEILQAEYSGNIPNSEEELLALPGVGKYTARSICANAFNQPLAILDTNVARILERFFGLQGERVKSRCKILWQAAQIVAPEVEVGRWNLTLLDLGALVCKARNPSCLKCPLNQKCNYAQLSSSFLI
jgi:A/G-specific adenine glycosylase